MCLNIGNVKLTALFAFLVALHQLYRHNGRDGKENVQVAKLDISSLH
jgi:hypothetical protein